MSEPKLTKKEKKAGAGAASTPADVAVTSDDDESTPGFMGYLVGGVVGLLLLLVLWKGFASNEVVKAPDELPHLVVMAEFADLADPAVRDDLARLQVELTKISDPAPELLGPLSHKILLTNSTPGEDAIAKPLDALTREEFLAASPYFKVGGWLSPRIFNTELTRACYRAGPSVGGRFAAGTRTRLEAVLESFKGSTLKLRAYSHDLRFIADEDRKEINFEFGVQTANSMGVLPAGKSCRAEPKLLLEYHTSFKQVEDPRIRSAVSVVSFWEYACAVSAASTSYKIEAVSDEQYQLLERLMLAGGANGFVGANGSWALLFVTTTAEAKENVEVAQRVSGNTRGGGFAVHPFRPTQR